MNNYIISAEQVFRQIPVNLKQNDNVLFKHEYTKKIPETIINSIPEATMLPNGYLAKKYSLKVFSESFAVQPHSIVVQSKVTYKRFFYSIKSKQAPPCNEAFFITDEFSNGYFHWLGDVLPKLELIINTVGFNEINRRTLIIPAMAVFPYTLPSLEPFNLSHIKVLHKNQKLLCNDILVSSPAAPTGNYRPDLMRAIRQRFLNYFAPYEKPHRKIFISRAEAPKRRIANEAQLVPFLEKYGFERIMLERLPFAEQVRTLAQAKVLIGNHGAGLTNMIFMHPDTKLVELRLQGDAQNNCFYSLASALNISYYYQLCTPTRTGEDTHTADFFLDPDKFQALLTEEIN